jgi:hypothetical protein
LVSKSLLVSQFNFFIYCSGKKKKKNKKKKKKREKNDYQMSTVVIGYIIKVVIPFEAP